MDVETTTLKNSYILAKRVNCMSLDPPWHENSYVGLESLTAERFPTIHGVRMYKTGDRARVLPNRELEILGRCDSMVVKVRGYSVELRAIEAAIMSLTDLVSSCCVTVQGDEGDDKFVIAYIVLMTGNPEATCWNVRLACSQEKAATLHGTGIFGRHGRVAYP
jgi:acyl-CoA synthetase (AMP-forming)/AMP-acid ligase II